MLAKYDIPILSKDIINSPIINRKCMFFLIHYLAFKNKFNFHTNQYKIHDQSITTVLE